MRGKSLKRLVQLLIKNTPGPKPPGDLDSLSAWGRWVGLDSRKKMDRPFCDLPTLRAGDWGNASGLRVKYSTSESVIDFDYYGDEHCLHLNQQYKLVLESNKIKPYLNLVVSRLEEEIMDSAFQQRPAKRSTPISQLIPKTDNDLNVQKSTHNKLVHNGKRPISKKALHQFHTPDKKENGSNFKKFKTTTTPTTPVTPSASSKKLLISEIAQTPLQFKIYKDHQENDSQSNSSSSSKKTTQKIPISDIKSKNLSTPLQSKTVEKDKVPLQKVLDLAQDHHHQLIDITTTPMLKTESSNIFISSAINKDTHSLLYQAQLPLIHLNNWFKITQHQIVQKNQLDNEKSSNFVKMTHEVISCGKYSDQLLFVNCKKISEDVRDDKQQQEVKNENVLLLNYRQYPSMSEKIQKMKNGCKIALIGGVTVVDSLKFYQNWKLES